MALATVSEMVSTVRVLLQDTIEPYRYENNELLEALNEGLLEARRLRPDLFLETPNNVPSYTAVDSTTIDIDPQYRVALKYYMAGHASIRDDEDTQDARAAAFLNKFTAQLLQVPS